MAEKYSHQEIEKKWQQAWEQSDMYATPKHPDKNNKKYILDAFAYPSGSGLHVGHAEGYIATDIIARFHRMHGKDVLYPIGWDAFGLPAENYAIKTGLHPRINTDQAIETFSSQVRALGLSNDWHDEIASHRPEYYRWTQWFFSFLYERGLAYKKEALVNWDPVDNTVLANEQVLSDGTAERSGAVVEQRMLSQWFFKITDYAERLLTDLDKVNWPESTKQMQRNWIGKSEGALVRWDLADQEYPVFEAVEGIADMSLPVHERGVALIRVKETGNFIAFTMEGRNDNLFYLSGGSIDEGENPYQAAVRETEEEIGVTGLELVKKIGVCHNFVQYPESTAHFLEHYFLFEVSEVAVLERKEAEVDMPEHTHYGTVGEVDQDMLRQNGWGQLNWVLDNIDAHSTCQLETFTTRVDTLFGVTYMVLAPEHPLLDSITTDVYRGEVEEYREATKKKTTLQRTDLNKDKSGVFTGGYVIHPMTGVKIPVFVADYVLSTYGTGAIMAVPAHDQRDYEFAMKMNEKYGDTLKLGIPQVVAPYYLEEDKAARPRKDVATQERQTVIALVKHWEKDEFILLQWNELLNHIKTFIIGGVEDGETFEDAAVREIIEETGYTDIAGVRLIDIEMHNHYFAAHKDVNRYAKAKAVVVELGSGAQKQTEAGETQFHEFEWVSVDSVREQLSLPMHQKMFDIALQSTVAAEAEYGVVINSGEYDGLASEKAKKVIAADLQKRGYGKLQTTYKLRDWLVSRQRYWGAPIPIVYDQDGEEYLVKESDLPVILPEDVEFTPTGKSPLIDHKEFHSSAEKQFGEGFYRESDTMDTFVCSSWYMFRFCDPLNDAEFASPERMKTWIPVDEYVIGAEHTVLHLLYARFFTKVLFDAGYIDFDEPFMSLKHPGMILGEDNRKMSKRWGNTINPLEVTKELGADTLRVYEMFMGPFDQSKPWNTSTIKGVRKFIERVWKLQDLVTTEAPKQVEVALHTMIKEVREDIPQFGFNSAVAEFMKFVNAVEEANGLTLDQYTRFLRALAPFAPFITEELWARIHGYSENTLAPETSIHHQPYPDFDESLLAAQGIVLGVQVNGKVRGEVMVTNDDTEETVRAKVMADEKVLKYLEDKEVKKFIYVPGKIVSVVV